MLPLSPYTVKGFIIFGLKHYLHINHVTECFMLPNDMFFLTIG